MANPIDPQSECVNLAALAAGAETYFLEFGGSHNEHHRVEAASFIMAILPIIRDRATAIADALEKKHS